MNIKYYSRSGGVIIVEPGTRGHQIATEVNNRNGFWETYDQGRMAHAMGETIESYRGHNYEWDRGWKAEASASQS